MKYIIILIYEQYNKQASFDFDKHVNHNYVKKCQYLVFISEWMEDVTKCTYSEDRRSDNGAHC